MSIAGFVRVVTFGVADWHHTKSFIWQLISPHLVFVSVVGGPDAICQPRLLIHVKLLVILLLNFPLVPRTSLLD